MGVAVRLRGRFLELTPKSLLTAELLERVRNHKPQVMALVKVRASLAEGRRMTALEIQASTGLPYRDVYEALSELWDWYEITSDLDGRFWLVERQVN